jgi:hypothetical protein
MNIDWRKATGPWNNEADNETWQAHGFTCEIKRTEPMGHLCGYVHIPEEHPWYAESYDDIGVDVHGGLTFSARCETSGGWMVGFDCAHFGDVTPMSRVLPFDYTTSGTYRNWAYVKAETERLAEQAANTLTLVTDEHIAQLKRWVEERKLSTLELAQCVELMHEVIRITKKEQAA